LAIAREEVARVLEEPAVADPPAGQNGKQEGETRPASPIGAVTVPPWQEGLEASVLPQAYQDLLDVAADAGRALRAGEFAAATGLPADKAKVEGLRSKLKLLAARCAGQRTWGDGYAANASAPPGRRARSPDRRKAPARPGRTARPRPRHTARPGRRNPGPGIPRGAAPGAARPVEPWPLAPAHAALRRPFGRIHCHGQEAGN
jgi:hypothetical protein